MFRRIGPIGAGIIAGAVVWALTVCAFVLRRGLVGAPVPLPSFPNEMGSLLLVQLFSEASWTTAASRANFLSAFVIAPLGAYFATLTTAIVAERQKVQPGLWCALGGMGVATIAYLFGGIWAFYLTFLVATGSTVLRKDPKHGDQTHPSSQNFSMHNERSSLA